MHWAGRSARKIVEDARASVAGYVGAGADTIVFTSGATEANNLALQGFGGPDQPVRRIVGATEHESVLDVDPEAEILPVRPDGVVDIARLQRMLADRDWRPCLVSVMAVNNETGVIQPIDEVVEKRACGPAPRFIATRFRPPVWRAGCACGSAASIS